MQIQPTKILSANRITLPVDFVTKLGLKEGDFVGIFSQDNRLVITPIQVKESKR